MPWALILGIGLKIIDMFITDKKQKTDQARKYMDFIKKFDERAVSNYLSVGKWDKFLDELENDKKN